MNPLGLFLEPPGPLLTHLHTVYMAYSERLPTRLNPLAERTCFSQALSDDLISSYYVGGLYGGLYERLYNKVLSSQVTVGKQFAKGGTGLVSRATLVEEALGHTQVPVQ